MKRTSLLMAALVLGSCQLFGPPPSIKGLALVVGGGHYNTGQPITTTGSGNLPGARNDAEAMAAQFLKQGYEVWLRLDDGSSSFTSLSNGITNKGDGYKATIQNDFANLPSALADKDIFVFYYTGHGTQKPVSPPTSYTINSVTTYLVIPGSYDGSTFTQSAAISDTELGQMLATLPKSTPKVVIADSCYSGGIVGASPDHLSDPLSPNGVNDSTAYVTADLWAQMFASVPSRDVNLQNAIVLTAASEWDQSFEWDSLSTQVPDYLPGTGQNEEGVFTLGLLNALKGKADVNWDGYITLDELYNYSKLFINALWNAGVSIPNKFAPVISGGRTNFAVFRTNP